MSYPKDKKQQHKKESIINALEQTLGVVTSACKIVGINRSTFYRWLEDDAEFKRDVNDISNIALDFAESKLHEQIRDNNTTATIFYLKTKGKKRGYIERQEITGADGMPNNFKIEIIDKTEDVTDK
jgi:hypothetical protein